MKDHVTISPKSDLFENKEIKIIEPQILGLKKMVQTITSSKTSYVKNARMPMV